MPVSLVLFDLNLLGNARTISAPDSTLEKLILDRSVSDPFSVVDCLYYVLSRSRPTPDFDMRHIWDAISQLYPFLTTEQQQRFISAVYASENIGSRAYILSELAPSLDSTHRQLAVQTALHDELTTGEPARMLVLSQLIEVAPAELRETVIDAALDTASRTSTDFQCFNALLTIVAHIGSNAQNALLSELFAPMSTIYHENEENNTFSRGWDLANFAHILTDTQARFIIDKVKERTPCVIEPNTALYYALPRLAPFDSILAVEAIRSIASPMLRANAMRSSLTLFTQHSPWFVQQIAKDFTQEPTTRLSLGTLLDFLPFLEDEQRQAVLNILLDVALRAVDDEKLMPFYPRIVPQLDSKQRQMIWSKLHEIADDDKRLRLMSPHIPFLPDMERAVHIQLLREQSRWGALFSICRDTFIDDQEKAPVIQALFIHLILEMKDKPVTEILQILSYFNHATTLGIQVFTSRFFPVQVLQSFGECLLMLNGY